MPTILGIDSFAHGVFSTAGGGLYDQINGTPTKDVSILRGSDPASLLIDSVSAPESVRVPVSGTLGWVAFAWRCEVVDEPALDRWMHAFLAPAADSRVEIGVADDKIIHRIGGGTAERSVGTYIFGTWLWVEHIVDFSATRTCYTRVRFPSGYETLTPATLAGGASTPLTSSALGNNDSATKKFRYSCWMWGTAANSSDWLGEQVIRSFLPNADGSHNVGTDTFRYTDNDGGAFTTMTNGTTVAFSRVDEWPDLQAGTDDWIDKSVGSDASRYIEIAFADPGGADPAPTAVRVLAALEESATGAEICTLSLVEGTLAHGTPIFSADIGSITPVYKSKLYLTKPSGGSWTRQALADAKVRFSSSNVSGAIPRVKSLLIEAVYPESVGTNSAIFELPWESIAAAIGNTLGSLPTTATVPRVWLSGTRGPTVTDDINAGVTVGDFWVLTGSNVWICVSTAAGAALWKQVTS